MSQGVEIEQIEKSGDTFFGFYFNIASARFFYFKI